MPWHHRSDRGELLPPTVRSDGSLLISGRIARPGILEYRTADGGTRRELLTEENLSRADDLGTLGLAPVTLEHPDEGLVTPDNSGKLSVGSVDSQIFVEESGFVTVHMVVRRRDAIDAIRAGKQELSPGYRVRLDETPGTHPVFGRYDAIQVERDYNHLAIVDRARGGSSVRLRIDGAAYQLGDTMNPLLIALLASLGITRLDSEDGALTNAQAKVTEMLASASTQKADSLTATVDLTALTTERDTLTADLETMKGERDALQITVNEHAAAEQVKTDAAERTRLDGFRETLKLDEVKDEDNAALLRRVALNFDADMAEDASADYQAGIVSAGMRVHTERADAFNGLRNIQTPKPKDGERADADPKMGPSQIQLQQTRESFDSARGE